MFRKKDKNQGIPDGVVGNNLKNARLTKKEREEIATTERKRIRKQMEAEAERYQIIKSTQRIIPVEDMIEMWLSEMTNTHTCVDAREYTEAYIDDDSEKTLIFPIIELEELVYQKAGREKYHIVCERGTQDGISRTMGNKVIDFKDMNNEPMPAHKYDDAGIRRDGINPLTHSGYWEEEP